MSELEFVTTFQRTHYAEMAALAYEIGLDAALEQHLALMATEERVEWVRWSRQGIAIQYTGGLRGGIFLDPDDGYPVGTGRAGTAPGKRDAGPSGLLGEDVLVLAPIHDRRAQQLSPLVDAAMDSLVATGYGPLTVAVDHDADLDAFANIGAYGIVHVSSHSWAWPTPHDIDEVYVLTGELVADDQDALPPTLAAADPSAFVVGFVPLTGTACFIAPCFVADHAGPEAEHTLVYLDFGYAFAGSWASALRQAGLAAVVGPDWRVPIDVRTSWATSFYLDQIARRHDGPPLTMSAWLDIAGPTYVDADEPSPVTVRLQMDAREGIYLLDEVRLVAINPPIVTPGEEIALRGFGFGEERGAGRVLFDDVPLDAVTFWSDSLIRVLTPDVPGELDVRVITDRGLGAGGHAVWTSAPIVDRLHDARVVRWTFSGLNTYRVDSSEEQYYSSISGSNRLSSYRTVPLVWSGATFTAEYDTSYTVYDGDYGYCTHSSTLRVTGRVSESGLRLEDLTTFQRRHSSCGTGAFSRAIGISTSAIYHVPDSGGSVLSFALTGPTLKQHIQGLLDSFDSYHEPNVTYVRTDWQATGGREPKLRVEFGLE